MRMLNVCLWLVIATVILEAQIAHAQVPTPRAVDLTVRAGSVTRVFTWLDCSKASAPFIQSSASVGTVERREVKQRRCGYDGYPVAEYYYIAPADFDGVAEIIFNPNYSSSPTIRRVKVVKMPGAVSAARVTRSVASAPAPASGGHGGPLGGRYVNQLGNTISVGREMLYFSGFWSGERVHNKPFALVAHSAGDLRWANYICSGTRHALECVDTRKGETRVYRRLQ